MSRYGPWLPVGDRALLRTVLHVPLPAANRAARAIADAIALASLAEVAEVVQGAASVLLVLRPGADPSPALRVLLEAPTDAAASRDGKLHEIPVRYDGPDLDEVARLHALSVEEVVRRHADAEYAVGFIGFSPGFSYLLGLPEELVTPRLATPRTRVPAGSVGIGGAFTGIYPSATPGGWHLLGRTDARLFDPGLDPPALLAPGDRVRFIAR